MFDVAIIGGGPAGCAASITLTQLGRAVVVLERTQGAADKFCGEFLSPDGIGSLERLGALDEILVVEPPILSRWSVLGPSAELHGALPGPALGISRRVLDPSLRAVARRTGVDVREGARVRRVEGAAGRSFDILIAEGTSVRARHVVCAAGRNAQVPGVTTPRPAGRREYLAFKSHFRGAEKSSTIRLFALGGLYVGISPIQNDMINVCFLARREAFEAAGSDPRALLDRACATHEKWAKCWQALEPVSERWLATGGLFFRPRPATAPDGITLCGDAAGLVSPFLGEGMSMALEAGCLAGEIVHRCLDEPTELAHRYSRAWRKRFGLRIRWGETLQRILLSDRIDLVLRWLAPVPVLPNIIVRRSRSVSLARHGARALRERGRADPHEAGRSVHPV